MNILILGNASDPQATHLYKALTEAGATVDYFDTHQFPSQLQISWQPDRKIGWLNLSSERRLKFSEIQSVFWRNFTEPGIPKLKDSYPQMLAFRDAISTLRSMMKVCPARWINSWEAYEFHKEKPLQLSQVHALGIDIPPTLITNDPEQVIQFTQVHQKVIFKPVYGGSHTQVLTDSYLESKRLSLALKISPITLQTYIPGTNVRSYVVGNSVYSAEIRSQSLDFREDSQAQLIPIKTPESIASQCKAIAKTLLLKWTAIDWRLTPENDYVFLEANPSPMFVYFEQQTGFPITEQLVQLLMHKQE